MRTPKRMKMIEKIFLYEIEKGNQCLLRSLVKKETWKTEILTKKNL